MIGRIHTPDDQKGCECLKNLAINVSCLTKFDSINLEFHLKIDLIEKIQESSTHEKCMKFCFKLSHAHSYVANILMGIWGCWEFHLKIALAYCLSHTLDAHWVSQCNDIAKDLLSTHFSVVCYEIVPFAWTMRNAYIECVYAF